MKYPRCTKLLMVAGGLAAPLFALHLPAQQTSSTWNPAGNPGSDGLWSTAANWSGGTVPGAGYKAFINNAPAPCIVNRAAGGGQISIGDGGTGLLIVTNGGNLSAGDTTLGNLDVYGWTAIGYSQAGEMVIASGGSVTFNYHLWVGFNTGASGTLVMNGGAASVAGAFGLGPGGGTGIAHINGGTLTLAQLGASAVQGAGSVLDISGGTIVVSGNDLTTVQGLVSSNKITAYGGTGTVNVSYNGSTTTITGTPPATNSPVYLSIQISGGNAAVSWPTSTVYYALQSATNLAPPVVWQPVTNSVVTTNGTNRVILPVLRVATYFSLNQGVDASTMSNKLLMGYQGWFGCPGDGSAANQWWHWFHNQTPTAANVNTDFLPDQTELTSNELFATQMTNSNGTVVPFYSSAVQQTVLRHFQWMQQNQLDGVFLQRFVTDLSSPQFRSFRNQVTANVMAGAQTYGRVFANMYDVSGEPTNSIISDMTNDWSYLVNTMHITNSPRYLRHKGKPVVTIWGFGFNDGNHLASPAQAQFLINWFKSQGCTVMGGVPSYWRTLSNDAYSDPAWTPVYLSFDAISPWAVGRYGNNSGADSYASSVTAPDLAECKTHGVDYMPVVFPGFSWHNENGGPLNQIPRNSGSFYWEQIYNDVSIGCKMIYGAMFDEVNEGTAMYKLVPSSSQLPAQGSFLALDADGHTLPSDWYLQLANQAGKMLRGQIPLQQTMPISPP
jgi:hypothetical protein